METSTEFVAGEYAGNLSGAEPGLVGRLKSWNLLLVALVALAACSSTTDAKGRGPLSAAEGGPDSSSHSGGRAGSAGTAGTPNSGGTTSGSGGATPTGGAGAANHGIGGSSGAGASGTSGTDAQACSALGSMCAKDSECCTGSCSAFSLWADDAGTIGSGPRAGWLTPVCQPPGCAHMGEPCPGGPSACCYEPGGQSGNCFGGCGLTSH